MLQKKYSTVSSEILPQLWSRKCHFRSATNFVPFHSCSWRCHEDVIAIRLNTLHWVNTGRASVPAAIKRLLLTRVSVRLSIRPQDKKLFVNQFAVKVKVEDTYYSASLWGNLITEALRYGTRCLGITQFYLHTQAFIHEWTAFAFPAEAGPHLLTPEGWRAELA